MAGSDVRIQPLLASDLGERAVTGERQAPSRLPVFSLFRGLLVAFVTLTGAGRCGKSRLALQVAAATERLTTYEAIRRFVERAALGQPGFAIRSSNAQAVIRIWTCLDGMPLAIELAAARVKAMPVEVVASRIYDRFRLLVARESGSTAPSPDIARDHRRELWTVVPTGAEPVPQARSLRGGLHTGGGRRSLPGRGLVKAMSTMCRRIWWKKSLTEGVDHDWLLRETSGRNHMAGLRAAGRETPRHMGRLLVYGRTFRTSVR